MNKRGDARMELLIGFIVVAVLMAAFVIAADAGGLFVGFVFPTEDSESILNRSNIFINASASGGEFSSLSVTLYDESGLIGSESSNISPFFIEISDLEDGTYWFNASAIDSNGGLIESETRSVLINTSELPGEVEISEEENGSESVSSLLTGGLQTQGLEIAGQAQPGGSTELRIQQCRAENEDAVGTYPDACDGTYPGACGAGADLLSCNDGQSETQTSANTGVYGGLNVSMFNSSVNDCASITSVFLCYERWVSATTVTECSIRVDANGGASFTVINNTCPGTGANPGVICQNITSSESWSCSNFFGSSGTKNIVQTEFRKASGGGTRTMTFDALFFNVTYSSPALNSTLASPANASVSSSRSVDFVCNSSGTNLRNVTFYWNYFGGWQANSSVNISGVSNSTTFSKTGLSNGNILWNCLVCNTTNCVFAARNNTLTVNYSTSAGIQIDGNATKTTNGGAAPFSLNFSFSVADYDNRILIVSTNGEVTSEVSNESCAAMNVSYGGVQLTNIAKQGFFLAGGGGATTCTGLWYLLNPSVGTGTIIVTYNSTSVFTEANAGALLIYNAAQQGPENFTSQGKNVSTPNQILTNITTLTDNALIVDSVASGQYAAMSVNTSGQVLLYQFGNNTAQMGSSYKRATSPGVYSMGWSQTGAGNRFVQVVAAFKAFDETSPNVSLVSPSNGNVSAEGSFVFVCNATDNRALANITLYTNYSGTWQSNGTNSASGVFNQSTFNRSGFASGVFSWNCYACDNSSNCAFASANRSVNVSLDATPPRVFDVRPVAGSTYNTSASIQIRANVTDDAEVGMVLANVTMPNGTRTTLTLSKVGDGDDYLEVYTAPNLLGRYNVTFIANDSRNNVNSTTTTYFNVVDGTGPSISGVTPSAGAQYYVNQSVNITAVVSDSFGVGSVYANITYPNGSIISFQMNNVSGSLYNFTLSDLIQRGNYSILIVASDSSGNINTSVTNFVRIESAQNTLFDVVDSNLSSVIYTQGVLRNSSGLVDIEINFTNLNVQRIVVYSHNESSPMKLMKFSNSTSDAGRFSKVFAVDFSYIDMINASVTLTAVGNTLYKCLNYSFSNLTCEDGYDFVQYITPGQNYTFYLNATDPGFGDQSPDSGTPDAGNYVSFGDGYSSVVNTYTATQANDNTFFAIRRSNGGGAQLDLNAYLNISYNITNLSVQGVNVSKIVNLTFSLSHCYNQDISGGFSCGGAAPGGTIEANMPVEIFNWTSGSYQQIGTYTGSSLTEASSSVFAYFGFNDFVNPTTKFINVRWKVNVTITSNGNDAAFGADYAPLTIVYDLTPPSVNLTSPSENSGSYLSRSNVLINASASDTNSGLKNITILLYNSTSLVNSTASAASPYYVNITGLIDGIYYFNASACDNVSNCNSTETRNVTLDTTKPLIEYGTGTAVDWTNASQTFVYVNVSVTEINEANITFGLWNATSLVNRTTLSAGTRTINWTGLAEGSYTYNVSIVDLAGNVNYTSTYHITLDRTAPNATVIAPSNGTYLNASAQNFTLNVSDPKGLKNATLFIFNSSGALINQTTVVLNGALQATIGVVVTLIDGLYTWFWEVFDLAGNKVATANQSITIDTLASSINFTNPTPASGTFTRANSAYVNLSASDANPIYALVNFDNSLISWLRFERGNGTFYIDDIGNNNGTCFGAQCPTPANGKFGGAYRFDAVNNFLDLGAASKLNFASAANDYAFSVWVNIAGNGSDGVGNTILGKYTGGNGYRLYSYGNSSGLVFQSNANSFITNSALSLNTWHHVVYTKNSSGQFMFVNGAQVANASVSTLSTSASNFYVGTYTSPPSSLFNGTIDEVLAFNRSLSAGEIGSLYNAGTTKYQNNFTELGEGLHTFRGYVVDAAGFKNSTEVRNITIDRINPSINFTSPSDNGGSYISRANIIINATSIDTNLANISINLYNLTSLVNGTTSATSPYYVNITGLPDGIYFFNATSVDKALNSNNTETRNVTLDTTKPLISFGTGTAVDWTNASQTFVYVNVSVTEINEANITFGLWNATSLVNRTTLSAGTRTINWTGLAEGSYTYNVSIVDLAGNSNTTSTYHITLDRTAPNATVIAPANGTYLNASAQNFTLNVSDPKGLKNATLYIYNSSGSLINQTTVVLNGALQATIGVVVTLIDGLYTWFWEVFDIAGNEVETANQSATIDTLQPVASGATTNPALPVYNNASAQNVSVNFTSSEYPVNVTFNLYNSTGSVVNTYGPVVVINAGQLPVNYTIPAGLAQGNYSLNMSIKDLAGNTNTTALGTIVVDTTYPSASNVTTSPVLPFTNNGNTQNVSVNFTSSEYPVNVTFNLYNSTGSIVSTQGPTTIANASQLPLNFSIPAGLAQGNYSLNMSIKDLAGNTNTTNIGNFSVDSVAPSASNINLVPALPVYNNASAQNVSVNFTSSEYPVNVTFNLYNSTGSIVSTQGPTTIANASQLPLNFSIPAGLAQGNYSLNITLNDSVGNSNTTALGTIVVDTTKPLIEYGTGTAVDYTNASQTFVYVNVSVVEINEANITFGLWNATSLVNRTTLSAGTRTINWTGLAEGSYTYNVSIVDLAGNVNYTSTYHITLDRTAPNATVIVPSNGTYLNASAQNFTLNISDPTGLKNATLYIYNSSGSLINQTTVVLNGALQATIGVVVTLIDGLYTWFWEVFDIAGNEVETANQSATIDTVNPSVFDLEPVGSNYNITNNIEISANVSDTNAIIIVYANLTRPDGVSEVVSLSNSAGNKYNSTYNIPNFIGRYNITIFANDSSGNINNSERGYFLAYDFFNPLISFISPPTPVNGSTIGNNNVTINISVVDTISVDSCIVNFDGVNYTMTKSGTASVVCNYTFTGVSNSIHNFTAYANDSSGNMNSTEIRFVTVNTDFPVVSFVSPSENDGSVYTRRNLVVNVSASDITFANMTVYLYNSTGLVNSTLTTNQIIFLNYTDLPDGIYYFNASAKNAVGLEGYTETRDVTVDTTYPLISYGTRTAVDYTNASQTFVYVNVSVTEINGANITFGLFNSTGSVNITTLSAGNRTINWTGLAEGSYTYNVSIVDLAGNSNATETYHITLDRTAPNATVIAPSNGTYLNASAQNFTLNISDPTGLKNATLYIYNSSGSLINQTTVVLNGALQATIGVVVTLIDGLYTWFWEVFDIAGNEVETANQSATIDTYSPSIEFSSPSENDGAYLDRGNVVINVTSSETNVNNISVYFYNNSEDINISVFSLSPAFLNITNLSDGLYFFEAEIYDRVGNYNITETRNVTLDRLSPLISYGAGTAADNFNASQTFVYVVLDIVEANEANITFRLYNSTGVVNITTLPAGTRTINWTGLAEGNYTYNATIIDLLGRENTTSTRGINLDVSSPSIQFVSPSESDGGFVSRESILVNATATDSGLVNVTFNLYNSTGLVNSTALTSSPFYLNYTGLPDGIYFFNASAIDYAGNVNNTFTRNVTIDRTIPLIEYGTGTAVDYANASQTFVYVNVSVTEINGANITFGLWNATSLVNRTTLSAGTRTINWTGLAEGSYTYNVSIVDLAGNSNTTSTYHITLDRTAPNATVIAPANGSYSGSSSQNYTVNVSDGLGGLFNATLYIYNASGLVEETMVLLDGALQMTLGLVISLADGVYTWFYTFFDVAGNMFVSVNSTLVIDTLLPQVEFGQGTMDNGVVVAASNIYVNVSVVEINEANITFGLWNSTGLVNRTTLSAGARTINWTNLSGGEYTYNVTILDLALNEDSTETRTISLGVSPPRIVNVTYSPNNLDEIDPGANLSFSADIVRGNVNISTVILQYYDGSSWNNLTMYNIGGNKYEANITLIGSEINYSYFIFANDTAGLTNSTSISNITSAWDCTWTASPASLGGISGFNERKYLGTILLNNTGDAQFANNNCSLNFRLNYNLDEGRVYIDGSYFKPSNVYSLSAKSSDSFEVNVTFLSTSASESLIITPSEIDSRSNQTNTSVTATIVSTAGSQAYLYEAIDSAPVTMPLYAHDEAISAYVRNLVGDGSLAKAAYNVDLNWSLPSSFIIKDGNASVNYAFISDTSPRYNRLNVTFTSSNLPSMVPGPYTLYIYSQGYNNTGGLLYMGNNSLLVERVNITLVCSSISDGIVVSACGSADGDYVAPVTVVTEPGDSGGGGGGSGSAVSPNAAITESYAFSQGIETIREIRGGVIFDVSVTPRYPNTTLHDVTLKILGYPENYFEFSPSIIDRISYGEWKNFTVKVVAPIYSSYDEMSLLAVLQGTFSGNGRAGKYIENRTISLIIQEITREKAQEGIDNAEEAIQIMVARGYNVEKLDVVLKQAKDKLSLRRNKAAYDLAGEVVRLKTTAFLTNYLIRAIVEVYNNPHQSSLLTGMAIDSSLTGDASFNLFAKNFNFENDTTPLRTVIEQVKEDQVKQMLILSITAFERGDYDAALDRAKSAQALLLIAIRGNVWAYIRANWNLIVIVAAFVIIFSFLVYRYKAKVDLSEKIKDLNKEENSIRERLTIAQKGYFSAKMSGSDYDTIVKQNTERLSNIAKERTSLRNQRIKILEPRKISAELSAEKHELKEKIVSLQERYFKQRSISESEYNSQYNILNARLAEIFREKAALAEKGTKQESSLIGEPVVEHNSHGVFASIGNAARNIISSVFGSVGRKSPQKKGIVIVDKKIFENLKAHSKHNSYKNKWIVIKKKK